MQQRSLWAAFGGILAAACVALAMLAGVNGCAAPAPDSTDTKGSLAAAPMSDPDVTARVERVRTRAERIRGLEFRDPVDLAWMRRDQVASVVRNEIEAMLPTEVAQRYRDAYAALGAFERDLDLIETMISMYTEQLIGLYSVRERKMYVRRDLVGVDSTGGLDGLLVHELIHALQHQHFPRTVALLQGLRHNDDVMNAISSLLEGDASFAMLGSEGQSPVPRSTGGAAFLRDRMLADLADPAGMLAEAPRMLRVSMIFPYAYGPMLAAHLHEEGGNPALDAALRDPPLSTLRVLHPDDDEPVELIGLPLEALRERLALRGCSVGHHTSAGVLAMGVLFDEHGGRPPELDALLERWTGDRFVQIECGRSWELAWLTRWESPADAGWFARLYRGIAVSVAQRGGLSSAPHVLLQGRTALVLTPSLYPLAGLLGEQSEIRAYERFEDWVADDCFPESPCPHP